MVLGREALFLPDNHPLLQVVNDSVVVQGQVITSSSGPSLTCLELTIYMGDVKVDVLVLSLMTNRANSPVLEGAEVIWLSGA